MPKGNSDQTTTPHPGGGGEQKVEVRRENLLFKPNH